jgi:voltage-gated potassium channel
MTGARIVQAISEVPMMIEFFLTTFRLIRGNPQFRSLMFLVLLMLLAGTVFYSLEEGWSVVDAFYFSVTTLTTVGLGDLAPETTIGKLFTVVYIFAGLGIIVGFIDTVAKETLDHQARKVGSEEGEENGPAS